MRLDLPEDVKLAVKHYLNENALSEDESLNYSYISWTPESHSSYGTYKAYEINLSAEEKPAVRYICGGGYIYYYEGSESVGFCEYNDLQ